MTRLLLIFFLSLPAHGSQILTLPHREEKLENGLRIFLVKYPSPGTVAYQLPVRVGSRHEIEKGKTGFAHFFEHLMFRGTKNMSGKAFGELYARIGAENNAWTWFDQTNYHGLVAVRYLPEVLGAEADRFMNLQFDEKALRDEAGAVVGEYNKNVAQPEFQMEEKMLATAFKTHPYGHTTMGYKEDILKYTERYKDVWPFFRRYYRPSNVGVVLVGDIDFDKTLALVKEKFGGWKDTGEVPPQIPQEAPQTAPRSAAVKLNKPTQTRLSVAYKVPGFTTSTTDSAALDLLAEMAFSVTSDFQKIYRFEKKWLDSVSASPLPMVDVGLWEIGVRFSEAGEPHREEVQAAIERTIAQLRETPAAEARLADTKKRFRNAATASWFGGPNDLASKIAWYTNFEPELDVINRHFGRLEEVTSGVIQDFAKKHLVDAGKTTVVLQGSGK